MNEGLRDQLDRMTPERRAKAEAAIARHNEPERRAELVADRRAFDREVAETGDIAVRPRAGAGGPEQSARLAAAMAHLIASMKARRESAGLSVDQVAARSGLERSAIFKLERGENLSPTLRTIDRYAAAVGASVRVELVDGGR